MNTTLEPLKLAGPPSRWASRKLIVALLAVVLVALNRKLGLDLSEADILAMAGLVGSYVLGQGWVDARQAGTAIMECTVGESLSFGNVDSTPGADVAPSFIKTQAGCVSTDPACPTVKPESQTS